MGFWLHTWETDNKQAASVQATERTYLEAEALEGVVLDVVKNEVHAVAVPAVVHRVLRLSIVPNRI